MTMYMLQLFERSDEIHPVDARLLREGRLRVGRDTGSDWSIPDPNCALSRTHCEFAVGAEGLTLCPLGANGVFNAATGERLADQVELVVSLPFAIRLGDFRIVASKAPHGDLAGQETRTMVLTPPLGDLDRGSQRLDRHRRRDADPGVGRYHRFAARRILRGCRPRCVAPGPGGSGGNHAPRRRRISSDGAGRGRLDE